MRSSLVRLLGQVASHHAIFSGIVSAVLPAGNGKFQKHEIQGGQFRPYVIHPQDEAKKIDEATELKIRGPPAQIRDRRRPQSEIRELEKVYGRGVQ